MSNSLAITNFINVSVVQASPGLAAFNTSNLMILTDEAPNLGTFGNAGYANYLSPTQVGVDFGTSSKTYQMANAVFSQQPNILNGGGQLVVAPFVPVSNVISFSGIAASGTFEFSYGGNQTAAINWNDPAATIQTKLRAVTGLSGVVVTGSIATALAVQMYGIYNPTGLTTTANSLQTGGSVSITITVTPTSYESLSAAITRLSLLVQFFGLVVTENVAGIGQADVLAAASTIQALTKIMFIVSNNASDVNVGGTLDLLRSGSFTQTRGLFYDDSVSLNGLLMSASYAGSALSVNFSGSNTTLTMNLKTLIGILPDPTITQTILNNAILAGADTYASYQGVSAVNCSGANQFFDAVYNALWLTGALEVAAFNYLQHTNTKIPQTENGMDGFKGSLRTVMEQAVSNQYLAPGTWTSPNIFGTPTLFYNNILQRGYYIYSQPIAQQLASDRALRKAPLIQIAAKSAGAIQSANIIVSVNS